MPPDTLVIRSFALTIYCTDLERSDRFYREVLGAKVDPRDGYGCTWYTLGDLSLTIVCNAKERSPASFPIHAMTALWLDVEDLDAAADRFARNGVAIIVPSDGLSMLIADPDGLVIEVWQFQSAAESG